MNIELEEIVFNIISHAGNSRSASFEALHLARSGDFDKANLLIQQAKDELSLVHNIQTTLIQEEAAGRKQEFSLLLMHAEDHLMTASLAKDLICELIQMYEERFKEKEVECNA